MTQSPKKIIYISIFNSQYSKFNFQLLKQIFHEFINALF